MLKGGFKMTTAMSRDVGGEPISGVPLRKNFVNLSATSKVIKPRIIHCVTGGDVVITWLDGTTSTITLTKGDSFPIDNAKYLSISATTVIHASGKEAGVFAPTQFTLVAATDVEADTITDSAAIIISGFSSISLPFTVTTGEASVNGGAFVSSGTVKSGDSVVIRVTSGTYEAVVSATFTVDSDITDDFDVTTRVEVTAPTAFVFTDLVDQVASTLLTSDSIDVLAIDNAAAITLVQTVGIGTYRINGGSWVDTEGTVEAGDTVELQATSPAISTDPSTSMTLTIGGVSDTWTIATIA
jgi:hypothetical protein